MRSAAASNGGGRDRRSPDDGSLVSVRRRADGGYMTTPSTTTTITPTALVTGGSRGLGRATALALADAGVDVVVTFRNGASDADAVVGEIEARGRRGTALRLDTTDIASFAAFGDALRGHLSDGRLDILVNNAGTALYSALSDTTEDEFDSVCSRCT